MSTMKSVSEDDEGKTVVDASGEEVGTVADVRPGTVYVEPTSSLTDEIAAKLGMGDSDEDMYRLDAESIETVTEDEVRLEEER